MNAQEEYLAKLHGYERDALSGFLSVCEKNHLTYYVIGGTLLGAVRHQGFIPWDDDIDVTMPRESYEQFLELAPSYLPNHLCVESWHNTKGYKSYFAKIRNKTVDIYDRLNKESREKRRGYLIDIIPLDGTPNNKILRRLFGIKLLMYRFLCGAANVSTGIMATRPKKEQILLAVLKTLRLYKWIKVEHIYRRMDRLFQKQSFSGSLYSGTPMGAYYLHEIVQTNYWGDYKEASVWNFEGLTVKGPKMWHEYLTHMYGDYRKLPPESERRIHFQGTLVEQEAKNH